VDRYGFSDDGDVDGADGDDADVDNDVGNGYPGPAVARVVDEVLTFRAGNFWVGTAGPWGFEKVDKAMERKPPRLRPSTKGAIFLSLVLCPPPLFSERSTIAAFLSLINESRFVSLKELAKG
jgi:hypothetical protein